jgi:hypothetical protein
MPEDGVTELTQPTEVVAAAAPAGVTATPAGVQVAVDIHAPTTAQLAAPTQTQSAFLKIAQDAGFNDKEFVSELAQLENPLESMFKQFENQRSLVGKKSEGLKVPGSDATAEQWTEFHKAIGVPEKAEDYAYEAPKAPEGLEAYYQTDDGLLKVMRESAHKAGVTPQGWKSIVEGFNGYYVNALTEAQKQADAQLKTTEETFKKHYGDKTPQVLSNLDKASSAAPDWAQPILGALQPVTKAAIASLLHNFSSKYVGEDKLDMGGATSGAPMSTTEYGEAYEKAFAAYHATSRQPHSPEHLKAKADMAKLRLVGAEIFKAG